MKKILLPLLVLVVISASGCINPFQSQQEVIEATPDLIIVKNQQVVPSPPILSGSDFSLMFEVFNQDRHQEARNVYVKAYDTGICKNESSLVYGPESIFYPLQLQLIEWVFKAPSKLMTGGIEVECPIRWKVGYTFSAESQMDVDIISPEKHQSLIRAGQTPSFTSTQVIGPGPLKIIFDLQTPLPVKSKSPLSFYITVENKGTGIYPQVPAGSMYLNISGDFSGECDKFNTSWVNNKSIEFSGKTSEKIFCQLTAPSVSDEKVYYIKATIKDYNYELPFETSVEVKPGLS